MRSKIVVCGLMAALACFALTGCDNTPPEIVGLDEENVEVMCGTEFNLNDYIRDNIEGVTDETDDGTKEYGLDELDYSITCDGEIYDSETGAIDTGEFGDYNVTLSVKDEADNEASKSFTLTLNPIEVQKGFYVYKQEFSDNFDLMGYASFENKSRVPIDIDEVEFQYFDKDGVTITGTDMVDLAPKYLAGSQTGYAMDTFSGTNATLTAEDEVQEIQVNIDYSRAASEDETTLEVGEITRIDNYQYDTTHFAAEAVLTNPHNRNAEYYTFLVGMYDAEDNLIAVTNSFDTTPINAGGKARVTAGWLPDSRLKPDATVRMQGAACVTKFAD